MKVMTGANRFVRFAVEKIRREPSVDKAIHMARFLGEALWKNATGHYQLADLERELIDRIEPVIFRPSSVRLCRFGHVLTKAYDTGGHTRLVERLVACDALQDSAVVVTETYEPETRARLARAKHGLKVLPKIASGQDRIASLVAEFVRFEILILYVHPYDIESVIAAGIARKCAGLRVLFFNHADHVFSYGYGIADQVLEISHFGWAKRGVRHTLDRSLFVGIPLKLLSERPKRVIVSGRQQGFVAAAGTSYKFRPAMNCSFPAFVHSVCKNSDCHFEVLGVNRWHDWWWWSVMWSHKGRIEVHTRLGVEKYRAFISDAAAFVDSFPMVGGTAFAEVMGLGIPCFGVLVGSEGYSPADLVKVRSVKQLHEDLVAFMSSGVRPEVDEAAVFALVFEVHDAERVASRIACSLSDDAVGVPPPWPCPMDIDVGFHERMWRSRWSPVLPVHVLPPVQLLIPFLLMCKRGDD
jgi:hypothetical protein